MENTFLGMGSLVFFEYMYSPFNRMLLKIHKSLGTALMTSSRPPGCRNRIDGPVGKSCLHSCSTASRLPKIQRPLAESQSIRWLLIDSHYTCCCLNLQSCKPVCLFGIELVGSRHWLASHST